MPRTPPRTPHPSTSPPCPLVRPSAPSTPYPGKCLVSSEAASHAITRHLADYVLVWTTRYAGMSADDLAKSARTPTLTLTLTLTPNPNPNP